MNQYGDSSLERYMERNSEKEAAIQRSMPNVEVPAIKFMSYEKILYVQMNIKSLVMMPTNLLRLYQGFLFAVEPRGISWQTPQGEGEISFNILFEHPIIENNLPQIRLVGDFPIIFHPHFTQSGIFRRSGEWIDYIDGDAPEKDIGSYLLRVARSLKYEEGYVKPDAKKIANHEAAKWYKRERNNGKLPTDNVQLPSGKTFQVVSDRNVQSQNNPKFQPTPSNESANRVKFEIKESQPPYSPAETKKTDLQTVHYFSSNFRREQGSSLGYEFYLKMDAFNTIKQHIAWGYTTHENVVEQGGILLGHAFRNPDTDVVYAIAEQAIPGRLARGSAGYLEVTHETWKEMLDYVDRLGTQLQVIGWYHTHPNNLDVFMSGTDRTTQERLFGNDWQFAIVLNPHKQIWRAFYGADSCECRGYVLASNALSPASNQ
ncbi:MAG: Mov34/MPN/PAD-1 family protein [Microcoleus sp. PH2017_10_PVI_O_A]|uniref:Mov34/MPN/PAD-1 family protein n=2 Tax=Microcoleus TaxID=44471 RepID=UPI001D3F6235|nr:MULTISPECIES: Mov34/MPN/PAD-1 family protein [unclassified Microcoleus]MCC3409125.1 Mov34/MPN/PAD-1 family protein [Microcoleus sp. PH2017_10_PVI_O_A]MCC3463273.1 Mov34/MPN/PAD-1 family protein [Microcoleus sp. PH2017_11_PCY_U_A]MCC3481682.1 Mov34/MPN/PAD-1 family protein [Microcoleus sp. PH2017_12_PCY_D_A]